jgi:mono/diheme cytochrome c family protein
MTSRTLLFILFLASAAPAAAQPAPDFERDVWPVLRSSCLACHSAAASQAELRLDSRAGLLKGGVSGPAAVPGKSAESLLVRRVRGEGAPMRMPPGQTLPDATIAVLASWIDAGAPWPEAAATSGGVDFVKDVQPIFATRCAPCHYGEKPRGGTRFDAKSTAMKVIVPGKSADSRMVRRLLGEGGEPRMPFELPPLADEQIAVVRRWIDEGAAWPESASVAVAEKKHWAFIAPVRPPLPAGTAGHPIDRFVRARLAAEGLPPSPEADRTTLLRRLSLDLVGLPPTIEEVDAYLKDTTPGAWERQVDRLLASPHYGERWGRIWLDAARYADSDGFEKDKPRTVWFYRDWVVGALNRDLPYDRFVIDQIAGDLLPDASQDERVATGFLRNSMINEEGGVVPEQFRMEAMFDRMDAVGKSVLGLTIQCAQCHNHKFDPLKQEEYYRIFAFLNGSNEGSVSVYTPDEEMKRAGIFRKMAEIEADLRHRTPDWSAREAAWEGTVARDQPEWTVVHPDIDDISTGGCKYLPQDDGSLLAQSYAPTKHRLKLSFKVDAPVTAFRLELMNDPNLPRGGPGRSIWGTSALTEFEVEAAPADAPDKTTPVKIASATADVNPAEAVLDPIFDDKTNRRRTTGKIDFAIDGKDETAWGIDVGPGLRNQPRKAVFVAEGPAGTAGGWLHVYLKQNHGGWNSDDNQNFNLGRFRLSITRAPAPVADPLPADVRAALAVPRDQRTPAQDAAIFSYWRTTVAEWKEANDAVAALWAQHPEGSAQLVLSEREAPRETHILTRGDFLKPAKAVTPGVPAFLHPLPENAPANRLSFAKWLVDRRSPTTARAIVNRVWQAYFGVGLVATPEDFGRQGEAPSHPELLDWLAVQFMDEGWSLKKLHRLIVASETYRQSSRTTPELLAKDPYNRLLARGPRVRVDAEIVRDIALSSSGLLDPAMGGPSVYPPAPDFLFQPPVSYGPKIWNEAKGPDRYRRALYTFRYRSVPYPVLQTFDAPTGDVSCVRRPRSNTPLQALVTLNEPLFLEAARALAQKTLTLKHTDLERVDYAFRRVLARHPTPAESAELLGLLRTQQPRFGKGEVNPWNLAANDPDKPVALPPGTTMEQLAAWTAVSRVLLNLDETITNQ